MPEETSVSCERPKSVVSEAPPAEASQAAPRPVEQGPRVRIGQKAPDFTAPGFINGGFGAVKLSEYVGKWVVLCFYPGDFTFV
ncbi:redoxin domain-containing protein [Pseudodesulfovibrio cashew]|nr:redoxin domain-containing protein [Pseudodesulfovibrio cashew]